MTTITIPPEALEKAAIELYYDGHGYSILWDDLPSWMKDDYRKKARAAALALLENWPGVKYKSKARIDDFETGELNWEKFIILPLKETE